MWLRHAIGRTKAAESLGPWAKHPRWAGAVAKVVSSSADHLDKGEGFPFFFGRLDSLFFKQFCYVLLIATWLPEIRQMLTDHSWLQGSALRPYAYWMTMTHDSLLKICRTILSSSSSSDLSIVRCWILAKKTCYADLGSSTANPVTSSSSSIL